MAFEFMEVLPVMTMQLAQAGLNLLIATCLGAVIGLERQWRQRLAGLRTNTLVALGAAIFVAYSHAAPDGAGDTRIAAQVVSGIDSPTRSRNPRATPGRHKVEGAVAARHVEIGHCAVDTMGIDDNPARDGLPTSAALDWPTRLKLISAFTRFRASATLIAQHFLRRPDDAPELRHGRELRHLALGR
jgi:MgtC family